MSDDEMDREWQAGRGGRQRPQSTVARAFSASLDELFRIDNSIADLDAAVHQKKQAVNMQTSELEALEARLRATEERLKSMASGSNRGSRSPRQRPSVLGDAFTKPSENEARQSPTSPLSQEMSFRPKTPTRPATAKSTKRGEAPPPLPGALPPTPGASEGEEEDETSPNAKASQI